MLRWLLSEIWLLITMGRNSGSGGQARGYLFSQLPPMESVGGTGHFMKATPSSLPSPTWVHASEATTENTHGRPMLAQIPKERERQTFRCVPPLCPKCFKLTDISLSLRILRHRSLWWPPRYSGIDQLRRSLRKPVLQKSHRKRAWEDEWRQKGKCVGTANNQGPS